MEFLDLLLKRRSVRKYTDEKLTKDQIENILNAGLLAPTSMNSRSFEFIVTQDGETLKKLSRCKKGSARMLENAACAVIVLGDPEKSSVWVEDCSIAMTNMHLMAESMNLGSCWIQIRGRMSEDENISAEEACRKILLIPKELKVEAILSLGHKKEQSIPHKIEELEREKIHYEKY